ncbi:unnamed protein product [Rotaria socialis]|uniref:RRM domain-containing protein n=3 Tax=Rotaria socialis TaxID=392032 RepID=A0A818K501_9BILA|nr:unnamed protein product [Rotaria socialis]CAF3555837.1 unnamed protein product [Rotaria socialis]CAF3598070.1 unnamed protein product [Rotaria socialis]
MRKDEKLHKTMRMINICESSKPLLIMDNGTTKTQQQTSVTNEYTGGEYSSQQSNEQRNESYPQHQISTTVTANRPSMNSYGGGQAINSNGNNPNQSGTTSYKLKQQRNFGSHRYDPLGAQSAGFQARNASQLQGQWNNGVAAAVAAAQSSYGAYGNPFGLPHHYQQQADMYAGYYGTPQQTSYGPPGAQPAVYGEFGQQVIPPESPKGGHVVYIYGIGQRATQEEIYALFQPFGRVLRVDIIIDFNTGLCKGYAFVAMEQFQEAQMAVQSLNATPFHGRQLQVRFKT